MGKWTKTQFTYVASQCPASLRMPFSDGIVPDCVHSLCDEALMSVWLFWLGSYHDSVHFQWQWTRCSGSWKVYMPYLLWTLRMCSLCISGPFSFYPLSVHHIHCLKWMAVLLNSVSNATMSRPSINTIIPIAMCIRFVIDICLVIISCDVIQYNVHV